jgi:hypothetical protein
MLRSHTQPRERLENSYRTTPATAAEGDWRRLKGDLQIRDIPVIVLSAHALAGERERAIAAGCDEFDTTPIEFDRLVANAAACSRAPQVRLPSGGVRQRNCIRAYAACAPLCVRSGQESRPAAPGAGERDTQRLPPRL